MKTKKILVADDDLECLRMIEELINDNFPETEVLRAVNGNEARDKLMECSNEGESILVAAVLDYVMPGLNGLELAAFIRSRKETENISIIMVSGFIKHSALLRGKFEGLGCPCLGKPIMPEEICGLLATVLQ
ncbi:MAG: response regulator [Candidatus Portnoybacteria bacterium]|nr:response regulator [Candidatus Portnoybacteria bacterium]MDD4983060.1 response regulator [Candidatus Portnoybacteria bacterium]